MRTLTDYLDTYAITHQHPTNVLIHKICVPAIMFSVFGLLKAFPVPMSWPLWLDWSFFALVLMFIFYASLKSAKVFIAMILFIIPQLLILELLKPHFFILSLLLFVVAWIGQFIGHHIEGKKPSFFQDLFFLLIGPIWVAKFFAKKVNVELS